MWAIKKLRDGGGLHLGQHNGTILRWRLFSPGSTRRLTLDADKGYDAAGLVSDLRQACVTPHVAQKSRQ